MVEEGVPILKAERVVYDKDDKAIEVTITTYHPDNYKCKIVSKRDEDQVDNDIFFGPIN
jgi:DNA-binding GntR family transcriptional regulator